VRVAVILIMLVGIPSLALSQTGTPYQVKVQEGVRPRMSPSGVATLGQTTARARHSLGSAVPQVVSVECTDGSEFRSNYSDPAMRSGGPVWIVRMRGSFVSPKDGPGGRSREATSLSYVVDDETGEVLAVAMTNNQDRVPPVDRLKRGP